MVNYSILSENRHSELHTVIKCLFFLLQLCKLIETRFDINVLSSYVRP